MRQVIVNNGKTVYRRRERFCAWHGWIDLFLFPDWEAKHSTCDRTETAHGVGLELPKAVKRAS